MIKMDYQWNSTIEAEDDMGRIALTFILLFIITLMFTIATTAFKVILSLHVRVEHILTRKTQLSKQFYVFKQHRWVDKNLT